MDRIKLSKKDTDNIIKWYEKGPGSRFRVSIFLGHPGRIYEYADDLNYFFKNDPDINIKIKVINMGEIELEKEKPNDR